MLASERSVAPKILFPGLPTGSIGHLDTLQKYTLSSSADDHSPDGNPGPAPHHRLSIKHSSSSPPPDLERELQPDQHQLRGSRVSSISSTAKGAEGRGVPSGRVEFSPEKAGQDVTPLSLEFGGAKRADKQHHQQQQHQSSSSNMLNPLAGTGII